MFILKFVISNVCQCNLFCHYEVIYLNWIMKRVFMLKHRFFNMPLEKLFFG